MIINPSSSSMLFIYQTDSTFMDFMGWMTPCIYPYHDTMTSATQVGPALHGPATAQRRHGNAAAAPRCGAEGVTAAAWGAATEAEDRGGSGSHEDEIRVGGGLGLADLYLVHMGFIWDLYDVFMMYLYVILCNSLSKLLGLYMQVS